MSQATGGQNKECFGDLERVFPLGDQGLREVSPGCWECTQRIECLRQAVSQGEPAQRLAQEMAARDDGPGLGGFVRRWSRLKAAARRKGA